ncbi:MAG: S-layer protein domain-containing protein [Methanosarcinaceae archaeon]|nr:S-layer protein domain-containing protein [Methanosarcinaceae archaeon]
MRVIEIKKILVIIAVALLFVVASSAGAMAKQEEIKQEKITDTFNLKQGYRLHFAEINVAGTKVWMQLTRVNGDVVDDHVFQSGEYFSMYDDETLIVEATELNIFQGNLVNLVVIDDLVQYNKNTGNPMLTMDRVVLAKPISN